MLARIQVERSTTLSDEIIRTEGLTKHYVLGAETVRAVRGVDLLIRRGEFVAVMGPSGSGKSTLMNMIGCLDTPTDGKYWLNNQLVSELTDDDLARVRNRQIGFVFQTFNLLPRATAAHNVELPLIYAGVSSKERRRRAEEKLALVGLKDRMEHKPPELSGGQRQRISIARSLALKPDLLLCDEPVSALDVSVQAQILNLMKDLQQELGLTYLFVSHNLAVVDYVSDEIAVMCGGRLVELAPRDELFKNPAHPYTRALLAAVPFPDPDLKLDLGELLEGKSSDSHNWPEPFAITAARAGKLVEVSERHFVRMNEDSEELRKVS